jgi:hypothetical protein
VYVDSTNVVQASNYQPVATIGTLTLTTDLTTDNGGTGLNGYTAGDMLYYTSGTALSKLAIGTNGYILTSNGTAPTWSAPSALSVANLLGGSTGAVVYQSNTNVTAFLAIGQPNQVLTVNSGGSAPQWSNGLNVPGDSIFASTGALTISKGTTAQRPTASSGMLRFNTTTTTFEGYNGSTWGGIGGAAADNCIVTNYTTISSNYTFPTGYNGESVGPITIASGYSVTVPDGGRWIIM